MQHTCSRLQACSLGSSHEGGGGLHVRAARSRCDPGGSGFRVLNPESYTSESEGKGVAGGGRLHTTARLCLCSAVG